MCYIDGQKNKYSVLNECNRMLKYNIPRGVVLYISKMAAAIEASHCKAMIIFSGEMTSTRERKRVHLVS
jgi:hypothetical protein